MNNNFLVIGKEVEAARQEGRPVVALESTIISHGMPYPQNLETARAVEQLVRQTGATPATIALIDGACHVGLEDDQLEAFARDREVWKVSLRDLPYVLAMKHKGATTVAATMRIAAMAGIRVFVTGGIGGVHRGAAETMDISADLDEMAKTSVAVVSAGIKSILDIGLTLEYLETKGVPVITLGQEALPGFYSSDSGHASPLVCADEKEAARVIKTKWQLGLEGGVLIANPLPEAFSIPAAGIEPLIEKAMQEAAEKNIRGKNITPFLLQFIAGESGGESLQANIALIRHNAVAGSRLAIAYNQL